MSDLTFPVPSSVRDVEEHCTVVVWKRPDSTNGPLIHYQLTFEREEQSISVAVDPTYHYYVIQPSDIPSGSDGPVTVEVSTGHCFYE